MLSKFDWNVAGEGLGRKLGPKPLTFAAALDFVGIGYQPHFGTKLLGLLTCGLKKLDHRTESLSDLRLHALCPFVWC